MEGNHWERLQDLFMQALGLGGAARSSFLEEIGTTEPALRAELEAMLQAHESPDDGEWLKPDPQGPPVRVPDPAPTERIGPYRLIESIGRGGMGQVYLAERADDQYRQKVAVKVVRSDFGTDFLHNRFRAERQILARLQHPHISTLLDGGVTEDGRPYLVMQYEPGLRITDYCDEHLLSVRERLSLFVKVCDAVQYAHTNLIVHRDLKPSNILVSGEGHPKLLDFGIAKILAEGEDYTRPVTGDMRMLTPEHAAPEQIRGETVTTAVDVYALGILLYELLVGERPFKSKDTTPLVLQQRICEEAPTRPSDGAREIMARSEDPVVQTGLADLRRTRPAALVQSLRGDLDQIVLKALRKEPERRYESVAAFAEDVRRYLKGHPVHAQPDTFGYRANKFIRRNWVGVATGTAFLVMLIAFAAAMTLQQQETALQRDRAERELAKSETVANFMADLFRASRPTNALGETITARELLERGVDRIDSLASEPDIQDEMLVLIGGIYRSLGEYDRAEELLERGHSQREARLTSPDPTLAESLLELGSLRWSQGRYADALALGDSALAQQRATLEPTHRAIGSSLGLIARAQGQIGDPDLAETSFRELLEFQRSALGPQDPQIATTLHNLGRLLDRNGKYSAAEESYRQALAIDTALYGMNHPNVASTLAALGTSLQRQRRFAEATDLLEDVVVLQTGLMGPEHPRVATALSALGSALSGQGRTEEAVARLEQAADIYRNAQGPEHPNVATVLYNTARVEHSGDNPVRAEELYREALRIRRQALGERHARVALIESFLGRLLTERGRYAEAEPLLLHALEIYNGEFGPDHRFTQATQGFLDELRVASGEG